MAAVPFRIKKGDEWSSWKAVVAGKTVELASANATKEEADQALAKLSPPTTATTSKAALTDSLAKSEKTALAEPSLSTGSPNTASILSTDKPKPGELRKGGLSDLSPARLAKFREQVAVAIAGGNVTLDRALVSIFRDDVPILTPEHHMLLSTGWELACEQYFVNGVPPAWIIILLGNVVVCSTLIEKSKPKQEVDEHGRPIATPGNRPPAN